MFCLFDVGYSNRCGLLSGFNSIANYGISGERLMVQHNGFPKRRLNITGGFPFLYLQQIFHVLMSACIRLELTVGFS